MNVHTRSGKWLGGASLWCLAVCSCLLVPSPVSGATIWWDGTSASWNSTTNWSTVSGAPTPNPGAVPGAADDAIFNITTVNAAINIALDADQAAQSLTFNNTNTTTIRGNTSGTTARSLTIGSGGITKNSGSGAASFGGTVGVVNVTLSADQTWTNNSTSALSIGNGYVSSATDANVALGAFNLIIAGTGNTNIGVSNQAEAVLTGTGTLTKNGTGVLQMGGSNTGYTGNFTINGGVVNYGDSPNGIGTGNLLITDGVIESRWSTGFTRTQGTGAGQIQITGGVSGLSGGGSGAGSVTHNIGAITWGNATFAPTEFVLQSANAGAGTTTLSSAIDLNGADRTIRSDQSNLAGWGTFSGAITNSTGTAGLIKTGVGQHILSNASNSYNGNTTVNQGILTATVTGALPGFATPGRVIVAANATIGVRTGAWTAANIDSLRGAATWSSASSRLGIDTTAGNFSYGSNITEALTLNKIGTNTLTLNGTNTYTGGTVLSQGTLSVGSATAIPSTGTISFNGGTIQSSGATLRTLSNVIAVNSDVNVGTTGNLTFSDTGSTALGATRTFTINGGNTTFAQAFTGSGFGITKAGAGTLTLTGNNSYTGTTTINAGTIVLNNDGDVTGSAITLAGSNTGLTVTGGSGVISTWNLSGGGLSSTGTPNTNIQMLIDGAGTAGSARVINVGILAWGRSTTNSTLTLTNGGQMNVNGEIRVGNPYYEGTIGNNDLIIGGGTATSTFTGNNQAFYIGYNERNPSKNNDVVVNSGGVLTGIGNMFVGNTANGADQGDSTNNGLTVDGTGTASMASVTVGYAQIGVDAANANAVQVTNGGNLTTSGTNYIGRATAASATANANAATVTGTGSSWNAGNQTIYVGFTTNAAATSNNNTLTVSSGGVLTNVSNLIVGFGTGTETGNQLVLNGGTISATTVTVNASNSFAIGSNGGSLSGNVTNNGSLAIGSNVAVSLTGNISGSGGVTHTGTGTTTLSGTNIYTGATNVSGGTLLTTKAAALAGYSSSGNVTFNGGTVGVQVGGAGWSTAEVDTLLTNATKTSGALGIDTTNGDISQWVNFTTSNLGSSLGLTKLGVGTLTLNGTNTYNGVTTVASGTLLVTGALSSGGGVVVSPGATFSASGDITGDMSFGITSVLNVANPDPSTLTLFDVLSGTVSFAAGTPGSRFGVDNLSGINWATLNAGTYTLITGTVDGTNLDNLGAGNAADVGGGKSAYFQIGSLQLVVVPEPAAMVLAACGLIGLGAAAQRRLRRKA